MFLSSPLIYVIITGHSVPSPRHRRIYKVSLPGALCMAGETDANKHADAMSSGRHCGGAGSGESGSRVTGYLFWTGWYGRCSAFCWHPLSICFNTSWNILLKSGSPARGNGRMLGLEAWRTRCGSHHQPLEEPLEQMSVFSEVRLTLKCTPHGPLRSLGGLSASCPPGDCRVACLYQIPAPSALLPLALTWLSYVYFSRKRLEFETLSCGLLLRNPN